MSDSIDAARLRPTAWGALKAVVAIIYVFMLFPVFFTGLASISEGTRAAFPPVGFTLAWWREALEPGWTDPILFSLRISVEASLIALVLGTVLAIALTRYTFPGRNVLVMLTLGPLILPTLVLSVGLLQMFAMLGLSDYVGYGGQLTGYVVISLPFCVRMVAIGISNIPRNVERAASVLGASPWMVQRKIVLPLLKNGLLAGFMFAFIQSFTDSSVSLFLARPGDMPVTIRILGFLDTGFSPTIAAVSMITLILPMVMFAIIDRFGQFGDFIHGDKRHA